MEFINVKLSDIGEVVGGSTPSTKNPDNYDGNIAWITPKDLAGYSKVYISRGERNITEAGFKSCSTKMLPKNSVLFSSRAPIGYVAISENDLCTNQGFKSIIPNEKVDYKFLYYLLKHNKDYIASKGSGSTFKEVSGSVMKGIELSIPKDINDQRRISKVLFDIDKKIELNNEINNNLQEFSNSIFKEWFVQFKYPEFNGKLKNSELGDIPENWEIGYFDDYKLTSIVKSGVSKYDGLKKYVATADVTGTNITSYVEVDYNDKPSRANMTPIVSSVWFAKMENSVKNIIVDSYMEDILENYIFSTGFMGVECINNSLYYIWNLINDDRFLQDKNSLSTGTLMAGISNSTIKNYKYLIPDKNTLHKFNEIQLNINKEIYNNNKENERLSQLRDILLPKLMNGEIDLENIEI